MRGQEAATDYVDVVGGDRTDFAVHLGDEQVGMEVADAVGVDVVEGFLQVEAAAHFRVDLAAGHADIEGWAGAGGKSSHPWRVVAFVGTAHQRVARAQCADDLGSTGEKGKDAHGRFSLVRAGGCAGAEKIAVVGLPMSALAIWLSVDSTPTATLRASYRNRHFGTARTIQG